VGSQRGHEVIGLALSPDGRLLAVQVRDEPAVSLWTTAKGQSSGKLEVEDNFGSWQAQFGIPCARSLVFAGSGEFVVGSIPEGLYIWSVTTGKQMHFVRGKDDLRGELAVSLDGKVVAWTNDGHVRFLGVPSGKDLCAPRKVGQTRALAFAPDGASVVFARYPKGGVIAWQSGKVGDLDVGIRSTFAFALDGKVLAATSGSSISRLEMPTGKSIDADHGHRDWINHCFLTPDGRLIATCGEDVRFWDASTGKQIGRTIGAAPSWPVMSLDGKLLAGQFGYSDFAIWEVPSGRLLRSADSSALSLFSPFHIDSSGRLMLAGGVFKGVGSFKYLTWDWKAGQPIDGKLTSIDFGGVPVFTSDQELWVAVHDGATTRLIDGSGKPRCRLFTAFPENQNLLSCSRNGRLVVVRLFPSGVTENAETRIAVVETATGRIRFAVGELFSEQDPDVALLPDGKLLVLDRGVLSLHAADTGKILLRINKYEGEISCFSLSRDGKRLLSAGYDTTALVWDLPAMIAQAVLTGPALGPKELEIAWADLGDIDAARAARAIELLATSPAQSLTVVQARLMPVAPATVHRLAELLQQLDSAQYAKRQQAERALADLGDLAEPGLRHFLKHKLSLESRRRAERLLAQLERKPLSSDTLRLLRAVELLERVATKECKALLQTLAAGSPLAWGTQEARETLERLANI
jgi:WD40 repeat protein